MHTHLDLCSGIGGFALAARWAGIETVGFCEIDPWCRRVLAKHWPEVPQHEDVKKLDATTIAKWLNGRQLDLITGGYPCQPFSHAGKRRGAEDDRHLWPWIAALVSAVRPSWCLFENVAGHVSMGLDAVLSDLESQDYACWPIIIPAAGVGAPHRRDRVWIIAHDERDVADAGRIAAQVPATGKQPAEPVSGGASEARGAGSNAGTSETVGSVGDAADGVPGWVAGPAGVNPWSSDWERGVSRVTADEADRRHKLKALGNAIVPQVAYQIMLAMLDAEGVNH